MIHRSHGDDIESLGDLELAHDGARTVASLLVFIHLFCIAAVLSGAFNPSAIQQRLSRIFAPYTKSFHLDPQHVAFEMTSGEGGGHRLHQWQVLKQERIILRLPAPEPHAGFQWHRIDAYAKLAGQLALLDVDDDIPALAARDIVAHVWKQGLAEGDDSILVRCVRFVDAADPLTVEADSLATETLYEANGWMGDSGEAMVMKRDEPRRTAPPTSRNLDTP